MSKQIKKSDKWFIKVRGSYLPMGWKGYASYIPYIAAIGLKIGDVQAFVQQCAGEGCSTSSIGRQAVSTVLYFTGLLVVMNWFARKHS